MNSSIKIISLNIETKRHLSRIIPFINQQQPDVVMLQEVLASDISMLEKVLHMQSHFAGMLNLRIDGSWQLVCSATFSKLPILNCYKEYYVKSENEIPYFEEPNPLNNARSVLISRVIKGSQEYLVGHTHFTWSKDAKPSQQQYVDLARLEEILTKFPELIFSGDFNAPRGTAIFDALAARYKDNIPEHITTTIDKNFHKAGDLQIVVDGLFTTPEYRVEKIDIVDGLSDHCGIVATVRKINPN